MSELNEFGQEVFDQTPVSYPISFKRPMPLHLRIRAQILAAMRDMEKQSEFETPEEADDFEMDEVPEFSSPYEMEENFDHLTNPDPDKNIPDEKESSAEDTELAKSVPSPEAE